MFGIIVIIGRPCIFGIFMYLQEKFGLVYLDICKNRSDCNIRDNWIFAGIGWAGIFGIFGYFQE